MSTLSSFISHLPSKERGGETELSLRHKQPGNLGVSHPNQPQVLVLGTSGTLQGASSVGYPRTSQVLYFPPAKPLHLLLLATKELWLSAGDSTCRIALPLTVGQLSNLTSLSLSFPISLCSENKVVQHMCGSLMALLTHSSNSGIGDCDAAAADDDEVRGPPQMMTECEFASLSKGCWV